MNTHLQNKDFTVELISTQQTLADCVEYLSGFKHIALDLEFDRDRNAYGFNLCLIQACAGTRCFIIDPLAGIDCAPLYRLLENPAVVVIFHSHGEDLRLLHSLGCKPANMIDTEIAAKLLGYEKTSLAAMLEHHLKVTLDKSQQKTNWLKRPLTSAQVMYASNDVIYLAQLMNILATEAEKKNLADWINQENSALSQLNYVETVKEDFLSSADKKDLSPYHQFLLNEWYKLRDELASKFKKPSYQVISNETLREIVSGKSDISQWITLRGVYYKLKEPQYTEFFTRKNSDFIKAADEAGLSKSLNHKPFLSPEEWERRKAFNTEKEKIKSEVFLPIKQRLADIYGAGVASFILSNSSVDEFIRGDKKISELKLSYRKELLQTVAAELKIDIAAWL